MVTEKKGNLIGFVKGRIGILCEIRVFEILIIYSGELGTRKRVVGWFWEWSLKINEEEESHMKIRIKIRVRAQFTID